MFRNIVTKLGQAGVRSSVPLRLCNTSIRQEHDEAGWIKPGASQETLQSIKDGGLRDDHPALYNLDDMQADRKVPLKGQTTKGSGDPDNPSQLLNSSIRVNGSLDEERVVIPTQPVFVDVADISPIPVSGVILNDQYTKHNFAKAGAKPSNFIDGTKYIPPGQEG